MTKRNSGSAFISRNRPPRVDISIDVEDHGKQKKIKLPFVMGVLAGLSGKSRVERKPVPKRELEEIDAHSLNDKMKSMRPRVQFAVPNRITGSKSLEIDLEFESMDEFSPAAIARRVPALQKLLEQREKLAALKVNMGGKPDAEQAVLDILSGNSGVSASTTGDTTPPAAKKKSKKPSAKKTQEEEDKSDG